MKRFLVLIVLLFTFVSCKNSDIDQMRENAKDTPCQYIKEFNYNEHSYLFFQCNNGYGEMEIIHNPDCWCQKQNNIKY